MIYHGHDVFAELLDKGNNGTIDATPVYWPGNGIDQRRGSWLPDSPTACSACGVGDATV